MQSERAFLDLQSAAAKSRLRNEVVGLGGDLVAPLRLQPLLQKHPLLSVSGATLVGFLVSGGLGRATPHPTRVGALPERLAAMVRRARRVVSSAVGTMLLANLRAQATAAAARSHDDRDASTSSETE